MYICFFNAKSRLNAFAYKRIRLIRLKALNKIARSPLDPFITRNIGVNHSWTTHSAYNSYERWTQIEGTSP